MHRKSLPEDEVAGAVHPKRAAARKGDAVRRKWIGELGDEDWPLELLTGNFMFLLTLTLTIIVTCIYFIVLIVR